MSIKPKFVSKGTAAANEVSKEELIKQEAERAVTKFEQQHSMLLTMKRDFAEEYPEAHQALQEILQQEDTVRECISSAHTLVQQAKETVGPFSCTRKWAQAGYDSEALTVLLRQMEDRAEFMQIILDAGIIKEIALTKEATAFFAQNPQYAKLVQAAWQDKKEKTAAVTDPKI
jgi:hypothetical protein